MGPQGWLPQRTHILKIVIAEKIAPAAIDLFRQDSTWNVVTPDQVAKKEQLIEQLKDADALIVRSAVFVDAALLENAGKLRVIGRAGVGVDNIELDAATRHGIAVMNTPGANAIAVAEHTIGLMLALARSLPRATETMHAGKWEKKSLQGSELRNKTLGIIGLGRIGMEVARRAAAFGMTLIAHDPFVSPTVAHDAKIRLADREEVLTTVDYLTLHVGLTPQTANMINATSLAAMKKGVRIVNCARGELIDEAALADAIKSGHVAGAALDVFTEEPPKNSPLLGVANVILTPHIGGSTAEAQDAVGVQIAHQVRDYLQRGVVQNAVNMPSLTELEYVALEPFITLGERLGSFLAQLAEARFEEIGIRYTGPLADWKTELIRNASIKGILQHTTDESVNVINARSVAETRGIPVHESKKAHPSSGGAANVLGLTVTTPKGTLSARGTVLHGNSPRLLSFDNIDVEAPLENTLLVIRNRDIPGVVGRVGSILGEHEVNIANFALGRAGATTGGNALAVVQIDGALSEAVLQRLRAAKAILAANVVQF
jgi:D-3-phosphoglycerate dehydrogenase